MMTISLDPIINYESALISKPTIQQTTYAHTISNACMLHCGLGLFPKCRTSNTPHSYSELPNERSEGPHHIISWVNKHSSTFDEDVVLNS